MPPLEPPNKEQPSTYIVQDRSSQEELARLQIQDQMITTGMGGVLPEQADPTTFHRVLDIGCATGGWVIEMAKTYPSIQRLIGVDISKPMIDSARAQAEAAGVADRVEFAVMDALLMLEFPAGYFDLVNQRFAQSWLRTWDWPKLLSECQRVSRGGGTIRLTEGDINAQNTSPTLTRLLDLVLQAFYQSGRAFTQTRDGVTSHLARLLRQHGLKEVETHAHRLEYRAGTPQWEAYYEDVRAVFRTMVPFLRKWTRVPEDYEALYQQALTEMQQPDFVVTWELLTAWGTTP